MDDRDLSPQSPRTRGGSSHLLNVVLCATVLLGAVVFACADFLGDHATAVAISADGRTAAIGTNEGKVQFVDIRTGNISANIEVGGKSIWRMTFSPGTLWIASDDGWFSAIDLQNYTIRRFTHRTSGFATFLKARGDQLFIGDESDLYSIPLNAEVGESFERVASGGMLAISCPDSRHAYWSDFGPQIHAFDLASKATEVYYVNVDARITAMDVDARVRVAVGGSDGRAHFLPRLRADPTWTATEWTDRGNDVIAISISDNGESVIYCDRFGHIGLCEADDGELRQRVHAGLPTAADFAVSADHNRFIVLAMHHRVPLRHVLLYDLKKGNGHVFDANYVNPFVYWISLIAVVVAGALLIAIFVRSVRSSRAIGSILEPEA